MNFVSFIVRGAHGPQQEYRRDNYDPDSVKVVGNTGTFSGKTVTSEKGKYAETTIDGAVKVKTVVDKIRSEAKSFWSEQHQNCMITFTVTLIGGIAGIAGAIALGVLCPHLLPVALAVGAVALGIFAGSFFFLYRGLEAKHQLAQWHDPVANTLEQRQLVKEKGFYYAFISDLKEKNILHPKEVEGLWHNSMEDYYDKFTSILPDSKSGKVSLIREFMTKSPLNQKAFAHTFGSEAAGAKDFKELSDTFGSVKVQYQDIRRQTEDFRHSVRAEKERALNENNRQRDSMLVPYQALIVPRRMALQLRSVSTQGIIKTGRAALNRISTTSHGRRGHVVDRSGRSVVGSRSGRSVVGSRQFERDIVAQRIVLQGINRKLRQLDLMYAAMTAPIQALHRRNVNAINQWAQWELKGIQDGEDEMLLNFFKPIKALLNEYKELNGNYEEQHLVIDHDVNDLVEGIHPMASAPPLEDVYTPPAYNSNWGGVVTESDWGNLS